MLLLALFLLQAENPEWVDRAACPTWEDCGEAGVRCFFRAREFQSSNPACAEELQSLACQAGSGRACLAMDLRDARGPHKVVLYGQAIARDLAHAPGKFWDRNLFAILGALFLIEWMLLRQMGWRTLGIAFRDAFVMNLVSAPVVLIALGEFDLLGWYAPAIAWFLAILIEWAVLARLAPPPYHQPLGAAILANTLSGIVVLGAAVAWSKWAPRETGIAHAWGDLANAMSKPEHFGMVAAAWAVLLAVEALMLRATAWSSFSRSARDALFMNLAALLPVGVVLVLGAGVFYHDGSTRAAVIVLGAGWLVSILVKSWVLGRLKPTPLSRPAAGAFLADLVSWSLMIGGVFLFFKSIHH